MATPGSASTASCAARRTGSMAAPCWPSTSMTNRTWPPSTVSARTMSALTRSFLENGSVIGPERSQDLLAGRHSCAASPSCDVAFHNMLRCPGRPGSGPRGRERCRPESAPEVRASRTAASICCCEVTPTCLRNLRMDMLKASSDIVALSPYWTNGPQTCAAASSCPYLWHNVTKDKAAKKPRGDRNDMTARWIKLLLLAPQCAVMRQRPWDCAGARQADNARRAVGRWSRTGS